MNADLRRAAEAVVVLAVAWAATGCTFARLEGNGPKSRALYSAELPTVAGARLERWEWAATRPHWLLGGSSAVRAKGYTVHSGASFPWALLAGPYHYTTFVEPSPEYEPKLRSVLWRVEGWGVLACLFQRTRSWWCEVPSGECIAAGRLMRLGGPLLTIESDLAPVTESAPKGDEAGPMDWTNRRRALKDFRYNRTRCVSLALGLVAWGTRNGRAYAQLFWIPIPLGSVQ